MEYLPLGAREGVNLCPVLLKPSVTIPETGVDALARQRRSARERKGLLRDLQTSTLGTFGYVETLGGAAGPALWVDSLGRRSTAAGRDDSAPDITGIPLEARVSMAAGILRGASLRKRLAPLVLLIGHGSTTNNNPHAASLHCGACGGHDGSPNARAAALLLNAPDVRTGLEAMGLVVPSDTFFVAGCHDTTTDEVHLFDLDRVPVSHQQQLSVFTGQLAKASANARAQRAPTLGTEVNDQDIRLRSFDWSEVRPEWGLAGNAFFIAAPRSRTIDRDLAGRAFLHSYEHSQDEGLSVLELILSAPMVVASWINLQYYASCVDPLRYGAGNKVLHNVVGTVGVFEGNGGDLRIGLPWQSVHDGQNLRHEPVRLHVVVEAPERALEEVLARTPQVRELIAHGWVHLFSLGDDGFRRYTAGGWFPCRWIEGLSS